MGGMAVGGAVDMLLPRIVVGVAVAMTVAMVVSCRLGLIRIMLVGKMPGLGLSVMVMPVMAMMPVMAVGRRLGMLLPVFVGVTFRLDWPMAVTAAVAVFMVVPMRPVVSVSVPGRLVGGQPHVHAQAVDAVAGAFADVQPELVIQAELGQFGPQEVGGNAKAKHGGQVHVAGDARETVVEQYFHGMPRRCAGLPGSLRRVMVGRWWGNRRGLSRGDGPRRGGRDQSRPARKWFLSASTSAWKFGPSKAAATFSSSSGIAICWGHFSRHSPQATHWEA